MSLALITGLHLRLLTSTGERKMLRILTVTIPTGEPFYKSLNLFDKFCYRQFKWFNPRGTDYSTISDKRQAPNYRD